MKEKNILGKIVAGVLFFGVLPLPYGYYTLLRIIVLIGSIIYCSHYFEKNNINLVYLFGFIGILFNPVLPVYLSKEIWIVLDFIGGFFFLIFNPKSD